MTGLRPAALAPAVLAVLLALGAWQPAPRPVFGAPAWPSISHPLGVDELGRDFLLVVAAGAVDFLRPGVFMVGLLVAAITVRAAVFLGAPVLSERAPDAASAGLSAASPPRLLLVMIGMLLLEEPSPLAAAAIVTALYVPVALLEVGSHLRALRDQEVLAGIVAHGLPARRILARHLLGGWLREPTVRHGAALFGQIAFTQIALAYIFGTSSVASGLAVTWGMEFKRLARSLPGQSGLFCPGDGVCAQAVATFHGAVLLAASLLLLGGVLRLARPPAPEGA